LRKAYWPLAILVIALGLGACSTGVKNKVDTEPQALSPKLNQQALQLFTEGQLAELNNKYHNALRFYFRALLKDSNNVVILNSITNVQLKLENYDQAYLYARQAVALDDQNYNSFRLLGEAHYGRMEFVKATEAYEKAVALKPGDLGLRRFLVFLHERQGNRMEVLQQYFAILKIFGFDEEIAFKAAEILLAEKKVAEAQQLYEQILELNPRSVKARLGIAGMHLFQGDSTNAEKYYQQALEIDPGNADVEFLYSRLLRQRGDWDGLIAYYQQKLDKQPNDDVARINVGEGYFRKKSYRKAKEVLEKFYDADNRAAGISQLLGKIEVALENYPQAESFYLESLNTDPDNAGTYFDLAYAYSQQGKDAEILTILVEATRKFPQIPVFFRYLSQEYAKQDRYADAIAALEKSLSMDGSDIPSLSLLANLYAENGQVAKSDSVYEKALVIGPDDATLLNNYAYSLAERDTLLIRAHKMSRKALAKEPENTSFLDTIAWILYRQGKYAEAKTYIDKTLALMGDEENAEVYLHAGYIYLQFDRSKAEDFFRAAVKADPDYAEAKKALEQNGFSVKD
jgi:tetratricopeptide (TPR) repeat protein